MSFFSKLFGNGRKTKKPCANCESDCRYCPGACGECRPLKEALSDSLYTVDHLNEHYSKYIVVNEGTDVGTVLCPACNAANPSYNAVCDYCGSAIRGGSGKIPVKSARDIPDPILEAQDIIYERNEVIMNYASSDDGVVDAISGIFVSGSGSTDRLGNKMSVSEIKAAASSYGVTLSEYLQGLDNGVYLTYTALKEKTDAFSNARQMQEVKRFPARRPIPPRPPVPPRPPMGRGMTERRGPFRGRKGR